MSTPELDAALVAARAGDERGISALFRVLHPQLLNYARSRVGGEAEDVVAEAWIAAVRRLQGFEGDAGDFRAWMFTIVRSRLVDHYRSRDRRPQLVELDEAPDVGGDGDVEVAVENLSSEQAVAMLSRLLPADQAEVVILRVVGDLSVEQVAGILGRTKASVRVMQHRALKRLATSWKQEVVTR